MATQIVGSLLALEQLDEEEDIRIYINSPGAAQGKGVRGGVGSAQGEAGGGQLLPWPAATAVPVRHQPT